MEAEIHDQVDKNSRNREESTVSHGGEEQKKEEFVVVDVNSGVNNERSSNSESSKTEKMCRICHFGSEEFELVLIGCDCSGELGFAHRHCAQAWFALRRDRSCEICGKTAKNIDTNNAEEASIFMMEWNEMRLAAATLDASRERSRRCKQNLCNFLMACLVLAFVLPWFFRGIDRFL